MTAVMTTMGSGRLWLSAMFLVLVIVGGAFFFSFALRRFLRRGQRQPAENLSAGKPSVENPAAFMTASMQAVIQRLREQEKELAELHRLEKLRAEQTERLSEAVTRNMPAGLLLVNATGLITSTNPAAEATLGLGALAYHRYTEVLGGDSALAQLLTRCLAEARTFRRQEIEHTAPDGHARQLGVTISPILNGPQKVSGALCLLSDITELTALQKQVRLKENLAALGELSAGIAHEFKNSLATISGYAQMIHSEAGQTELADHARHILDQTRALTHLVTEFLRFARPFDVADEPVAMRSLVERAAGEIREALPRVAVATEGEFIEVAGDEALLRQALLNLMRNAAEACDQPGGGAVTVRGWVDRNAEGEIQRISITDNGPGIPPDQLSKLFLPFHTTKANGTGMGLAVVQKIVVQHGGGVKARNQPQGGAEFMLWLPCRRKAAQAIDSAVGSI